MRAKGGGSVGRLAGARPAPRYSEFFAGIVGDPDTCWLRRSGGSATAGDRAVAYGLDEDGRTSDSKLNLELTRFGK